MSCQCMSSHAMSSRRDTLSPLQREWVCLLSIEKGDTLSPLQVEGSMLSHVMSCQGMSCHVIEKRDTLSSAERRSMSCHVRACHVMSCHVLSSRRETLSPPQREWLCLLSIFYIEGVSLFSLYRKESLSVLYISMRVSLCSLYRRTHRKSFSILYRRESLSIFYI